MAGPKEIVGFWTNITERKQAEEQAVQASRPEVEIGEDELPRSNNHNAARLVIASLIIGSSFVLLAARGPLMWGVSIVGLTAFACSLVSTFIWLLAPNGGP
jgi:hypothetical protein